MTEQDEQAALSGFLIAGGEDTFPVERRPWRRHGIYLSAICAVVHVSVHSAHWTDTDRDAAKDRLYRYLRRIAQTLLEFDVIRPVAAVVSLPADDTDAAREIRTWGGDQGWHRGGFTLYAEDHEDAGRRCLDLLNPQVDLLVSDAPQEQRTHAWYAETMAAAGPDGSAEWRSLSALCADLFKETVQTDRELTALTDWKSALVDRARRLAGGEALR